MIFMPGTRNIHFAMVVAIGGFHIFTGEMLGCHMKFQSLLVSLCWSALVSLHHPLNATKVLESACSFSQNLQLASSVP